MKLSPIVLLSGLFASAFANPVAATEKAPLTKRTTNFNDLFAQVDAHAQAALDICASADVDINADIDVRTDVAAQLKADLDACAQLLAEAAAELQASARAEVEEANDSCGCEEEVIVEKSKKFCEDVNVIVETLGEEADSFVDACAEYVKPAMTSFGDFTVCVDDIFAGIGASVQAAVEATLGATLSAALGLDLGASLGLGLGGLIGIGR
ncbi:hypothetical protein VUR80DRAFT_9438 [Thermomyces stellatus]